MDGLCSGDLASITGGKLKLGILPPLGGEWEPVLRIVTDSRAARRGDVFWDLNPSPSAPGASPEEAFARGAVGIVSSRRFIEPWAGAFVVQVRDARHALLDVGRWARRRRHGPVVAVSCTPRSPLPRLLRALNSRNAGDPEMQGTTAGAATEGTEETVNLLTSTCVRSPIEMALCLVHEPCATSTTVLPIDSERIEDSAAISHLCSPHLAVINGTPRGRTDSAGRLATSLLEALPAGGTAVMIDPPGGSIPLEAPAEVPIIHVGTAASCDWQVRHIRWQGNHAHLELNRQQYTWRLRPDWAVLEIAAAFVVSRLWGIHPSEFAWSCETLTERGSANNPFEIHSSYEPTAAFQNTSMTKEKPQVPPLVSGLRESDTALPPGLKRFAC